MFLCDALFFKCLGIYHDNKQTKKNHLLFESTIYSYKPRNFQSVGVHFINKQKTLVVVSHDNKET